MATVTKKYLNYEQSYAGPTGNAWKKVFNFTVNASGISTDTDLATAVQVNDVVRVGVLPAGLEIHDGLAIVSDAFAASTTAKIGFAYVDGVDSATVPQSDTYFFAALATSSAGRTRANNTAVRPLVLPKDAYLVLTRTGAADSAAGVLDLVVEGINKGRG